MVKYDFTPVEVGEIYRNGFIVDLMKYKDLIPNTLASLEEIPSLKLAHMTAKGELLRFFQIVFNVQHITTWTNIRVDWLDALKLPEPKTTDDFYNALKAFRDNDMNKSGVKDEALQISSLENINLALGPTFGAYGLRRPNDSWYADAGGKVYHVMVSPEAREYVAYVAKLFQEGLIWSSTFNANITEESRNFVSQNNRAGQVGPYWDAILQNLDEFSRGLPGEYTNLLPLTDGKHKRQIGKRNYAGGINVMVSSKTKVPERVISFLDYFQSYDGAMLEYYGEPAPGGNYFVKDDSAAIALGLPPEKTVMVPTAKSVKISDSGDYLWPYLGVNTGMWPGKIVGTSVGIILDYQGFDTAAARRMKTDIKGHQEKLGWVDVEGNYFYELPLTVADEAQSLVLSEHADLFTYMDEMYKKFMTGVEPMSNWDTFVRTCNNIGLPRVTAVQQARYDAYKAMSK
jgi:putative aldouronate transport system substrate-binding protein